jgi:hypothetical protein
MKKGVEYFLSPSKSKIILFILIDIFLAYSLLTSIKCLVSSNLSCKIVEFVSIPIFVLVNPFLAGSGYLALFLGFLVSLIYSYIISCLLVWLVRKIAIK